MFNLLTVTLELCKVNQISLTEVQFSNVTNKNCAEKVNKLKIR